MSKANYAGIRFYLEFNTPSERRKGKHSGNVFAAFVDNGRNSTGGYSGLGSVFDYPNSLVATTGTSFEVQHSFRMKRINRDVAKQIHPALFEALNYSQNG